MSNTFTYLNKEFKTPPGMLGGTPADQMAAMSVVAFGIPDLTPFEQVIADTIKVAIPDNHDPLESDESHGAIVDPATEAFWSMLSVLQLIKSPNLYSVNRDGEECFCFHAHSEDGAEQKMYLWLRYHGFDEPDTAATYSVKKVLWPYYAENIHDDWIPFN